MNVHRTNPTLALLFDGNRIVAVSHRPDGGSVSASLSLPVNPLTDDPALVGEALRSALHEAGLGALRQATVCLSLQQTLVTTVVLPPMPPEAEDGFVRLQAEQEFLLPPNELALAVNRYALPDGTHGATLAGLALKLHARLLEGLRLAGLKQVQVCVAASLAPRAVPGNPAISATLLATRRTVDLAISAGGGLLALRRLAGSDTQPGNLDTAELAALAADLRISLSRLPSGVREAIREVHVVGREAETAALLETLSTHPSTSHWRFTTVATNAAIDSGSAAGRLAELAASGLVELEQTALRLEAPVPVHTARNWRGMAASTGGRVLAAALVLLLALGVAFYLQVRELRGLRATWQDLEPRAEAVRASLDVAKDLGPWFSDTPDTLDIWRVVTTAFPETGSVWATRLEIKERSQVTVTGKARNRDAWLSMKARLAETPGVQDLRISQASDANDGKSPLSFSLTFTWSSSAALRAAATAAAKARPGATTAAPAASSSTGATGSTGAPAPAAATSPAANSASIPATPPATTTPREEDTP